MAAFMGDDPEQQCMIIVDPSAKSFITELRQRGYYVKEGDNDVLDGIREVSTLFSLGRLHIHRRCTGLIKELHSYVWDDKAGERGEEKPVKMQDHGPDALRYLIHTVLPDWRKTA
jgi:phage terminase large subunit